MTSWIGITPLLAVTIIAIAVSQGEGTIKNSIGKTWSVPLYLALLMGDPFLLDLF